MIGKKSSTAFHLAGEDGIKEVGLFHGEEGLGVDGFVEGIKSKSSF
jgi:hypothetical protein